MNPILLLALAIPLSCLALLVSLALLGVLTLGGVIHLVAEVGRVSRPTPPRLPTTTIMSGGHRLEMRRGEKDAENDAPSALGAPLDRRMSTSQLRGRDRIVRQEPAEVD